MRPGGAKRGMVARALLAARPEHHTRTGGGGATQRAEVEARASRVVGGFCSRVRYVMRVLRRCGADRAVSRPLCPAGAL